MMDITVNAFWDPRAEVWTASSDDLLGLCTEAPTLDKLANRITEAGLDILAAKGKLDSEDEINFKVECDFLQAFPPPTNNRVSLSYHDSFLTGVA